MTIKLHQPTIPPALVEKLRRRHGQYTQAKAIFHLVWLDGENFVGVFGDGDNGSYEWFYFSPARFLASDCGWGSVAAALREALKFADL